MFDSVTPCMDCSLPGSSVHGILQARMLEWVAIPSSRGSSWPRDWTWVSSIAGRFFTLWATREAIPPCSIYKCCGWEWQRRKASGGWRGGSHRAQVDVNTVSHNAIWSLLVYLFAHYTSTRQKSFQSNEGVMWETGTQINKMVKYNCALKKISKVTWQRVTLEDLFNKADKKGLQAICLRVLCITYVLCVLFK